MDHDPTSTGVKMFWHAREIQFAKGGVNEETGAGERCQSSEKRQFTFPAVDLDKAQLYNHAW